MCTLVHWIGHSVWATLSFFVFTFKSTEEHAALRVCFHSPQSDQNLEIWSRVGMGYWVLNTTLNTHSTLYTTKWEYIEKWASWVGITKFLRNLWPFTPNRQHFSRIGKFDLQPPSVELVLEIFMFLRVPHVPLCSSRTYVFITQSTITLLLFTHNIFNNTFQSIFKTTTKKTVEIVEQTLLIKEVTEMC